jgi:hypothetical protein
MHWNGQNTLLILWGYPFKKGRLEIIRRYISDEHEMYIDKLILMVNTKKWNLISWQEITHSFFYRTLTWDFFHQTTSLGHWYTVKAFLHKASNSRRYSTAKSSIFTTAVSMTPLSPRLWNGCHRLFFIDIPFKGTQTLSNIIGTVVTGTALSLTPLSTNFVEDFMNSKPYSKRLEPLYQWPFGSFLMKKIRGQKSCVRVSLKYFFWHHGIIT